MGRVKIREVQEEVVYKVYTGKPGRPKTVRRPFRTETSTAVSDNKRRNVGSSSEFDEGSNPSTHLEKVEGVKLKMKGAHY
ncbi:hypothetical protein BaRGS_00014705 [Batillaria attramentaria]|uniref:Uncharacterized protein n=1 Tax=Batillaria attramentaria TaxID=370345 RepID=A0ABD0L3Z0_9CAEN